MTHSLLLEFQNSFSTFMYQYFNEYEIHIHISISNPILCFICIN